MADQKEQPKPFFTTEKVTLYAPKGAKYHKHGQATEVQVRQKEKFLKLGYTETPEEAQKAVAAPAIAEVAPAAETTPIIGGPAKDPNDPKVMTENKK